jgi:FixJ family two-component response regulator
MDRGPVKVLLIDDDEDDYVLTRALLAEVDREAYQLHWAGSYAAGLEAIGRGGHDVYLLDYRLGDRTGLELLREACRRGCPGPLILLTGQGDRDVDVQAMRAGAADYLTKSRMDAHQLERSIRHALERKRAEESLRRMHEELEAHVRERTAELAAANEALEAEIAERARAERRLAVQYAVSRMLAEAADAETAIPEVLRLIGEGLDWQWGALWTVDRQAECLQCGTTWQAAQAPAPELEACSHLVTFRPGRGLPGRVWVTGQPAWIGDLRDDENLLRQEIATQEGMTRAFGFPVRGRSEILGVIEFFGGGAQPRIATWPC